MFAISNPTIMVVLGTKEYWGQDPTYCIKKATPSIENHIGSLNFYSHLVKMRHHDPP